MPIIFKEKGEANKSAAALKAQARKMQDAMNGTSLSIFRPDSTNQVHCDNDWKPACEAYTAITSRDYDKAKKLIDALLVKEKQQETHKQPEISRLIHLGEGVYERRKRTLRHRLC